LIARERAAGIKAKRQIRARAAGEAAGYSFAGQSGRQVTKADFAVFDYILAMDRNNLSALQAMQPDGYSGHLGLFLEFGNLSVTEVPDPYYGGDAGFAQVLALIEKASDGLITAIKTQGV
jgi:protein-tyrosine phosphatase